LEPPPAPVTDAEDTILGTLLAARPSVTSTSPRVDVGDDAAVLADGTAVTVDALVEGVHWDDRLSPADVGHKLVAVSVSDLAATGASPTWAVLTLALPPGAAEGFVSGFARGLADALRRWDIALVGGDTVRTGGPVVVSLTLAGRCVGAPLVRSGARPGDDVWVTGTPGLAGLGWRTADAPPEALEALRRPDPPLAFALDVARSGLAHAAMDLSDGLERDLPRLCAASGVAAEIDAASLPSHPALEASDDALVHRLAGGDDYQLLLAAPPAAHPALVELAARHGTRLTCIGRVLPAHAAPEHARSGAFLRHGPWPDASFLHFPAER
jgi:thiamine-monophosphate kinase